MASINKREIMGWLKLDEEQTDSIYPAIEFFDYLYQDETGDLQFTSRGVKGARVGSLYVERTAKDSTPRFWVSIFNYKLCFDLDVEIYDWVGKEPSTFLVLQLEELILELFKRKPDPSFSFLTNRREEVCYLFFQENVWISKEEILTWLEELFDKPSMKALIRALF
jgi:hypothetical protein